MYVVHFPGNIIQGTFSRDIYEGKLFGEHCLGDIIKGTLFRDIINITVLTEHY